MLIGKLLTRHARYRPDHTALVFGTRRWSFRAMNAATNQVAHALRALGIGTGDAVATLLPNCPEQLWLYWACAKLGAVVVPMSPLLKADAIATLAENAGSGLIVSQDKFAAPLAAARGALPALAPERIAMIDGVGDGSATNFGALAARQPETEPPEPPITDDAPFNIIYSSGTTGAPKGIVHTHRVRANYATIFASSWRMTPESVVLHTGAIVFNGAFVTLMPTLFTGATYVLGARFDPDEVIDTVERRRVTHMMLVPSQIIALMNAPGFCAERLGSLEMVMSLGAPLHLEHKQRLDAVLPRRFYELYGLTEGFVTILDREDYPTKPGSVGVPPPFYELRICDDDGRDVTPGTVGEIVGRGPILMPGYHDRPDLTAQAIRDGWLFTGDLGRVDEDGFLYLVDRKKDLIISGGINVFPRDIEEVVVQHPAVAEAAVFGVADPKWGETPIAAVVVRDDAPSADELRAWINERVVASYQKVSRVVIEAEFPRNVAGKTLKRVLRERYQGDGGGR